jgi:hypothetical protein
LITNTRTQPGRFLDERPFAEKLPSSCRPVEMFESRPAIHCRVNAEEGRVL